MKHVTLPTVCGLVAMTTVRQPQVVLQVLYWAAEIETIGKDP